LASLNAEQQQPLNDHSNRDTAIAGLNTLSAGRKSFRTAGEMGLTEMI
jgi:hypothetical protein